MCVQSPRVSVSPVLWKFYNQILLNFKVRFPGDFPTLCWIPRSGNLSQGLELSQQYEYFFGIIVLQFVDRPPGGSMVGLMATSSTSNYATPPICQGLGPCSRPLLTHASAGDPQTLTGSSGSVSCGVTAPFPGSWCTEFCWCPSSINTTHWKDPDAGKD